MGKKLFNLLFLVAVIVVSGCAAGGGGGSSNGVVISSFIADPSEVQGGDTVFLLMDIENVGGEIATGISASLIGLPTQWSVSGSTGVPSQMFPPSGGLPGELATIEWQATAPPSETDITYSAEGMVTYSYATHMEALVRVANRDWIMSLPPSQRQAELNKLGTISSSAQEGPVHLTIKSSTGAGYAGTTTRLILDIQNVGSGFALSDRISLNVQGLNCEIPTPLTLIRGQGRQIRCTAALGQVERWQDVRVDADLSYTYVIRKPIQITVLGTPV